MFPSMTPFLTFGIRLFILSYSMLEVCNQIKSSVFQKRLWVLNSIESVKTLEISEIRQKDFYNMRLPRTYGASGGMGSFECKYTWQAHAHGQVSPNW